RPLTRRLILQKARRHPKRLRRIVSTRFQVLFHSPPGVLFTFPSRYLSAIGQEVVFRLTRWSWQIHTGFHGPGPTREQHHAMQQFRLRGSHPLRHRTHHDFDYHHTSTPDRRQTLQIRPTTPDLHPLHPSRLRVPHPLRPRTPPASHYHHTSTPARRQTIQIRPTTPDLQPLPGITQTRFSHLRFRSPLLTESLLFSLPAGTEM